MQMWFHYTRYSRSTLVTLVLFDIDGTLTATSAVDAQCYAAAFYRTFGFPLPTTDWDVY